MSRPANRPPALHHPDLDGPPPSAADARAASKAGADRSAPMSRRPLLRAIAIASLAGLGACASTKLPPGPQYLATSEVREAEYLPYLQAGTHAIAGQAFLVQRGGNAIKAAGRTVTLDPATSVGNDWWEKAGKTYADRLSRPASPAFAKARRTTVADADGRFRFTQLPPGNYWLRTEVTWEGPTNGPVQGGLVGRLITVPDATNADVVLNSLAR